jgi:hypothetical protein
MKTYRATPTAAQIAGGYFILPRKLYLEWNNRFPFHEYDAEAFGVQYKRLRLDQNYRVRVRLKDHLVPGEAVYVDVVERKSLIIGKL